ncbi:hydrogenase large subunit [Pengzhenrongella sicca]|uniref:NADH-quinone oxidoreductase subunit C n=1 Tax=Pengzhenrongella sicca TaxID=2819238 RepID=A0A8A4ZJS1_9MICO|nr:NADH-quinone oxidoreductase subunit C [Pengzhenrongella sicca]QTE30756.1 NADH-quinone oxidoreductase subunit C [Pengzhenrongella sicca]
MTSPFSRDGVAAGLHRVVRDMPPGMLALQASALLVDGFRLALVAAHDEGTTLRVVYLFLAGGPDRRVELQVTLAADDPRLPSLASVSFAASRFEREMHDLYGIVPVNHPLPHRMVRHAHWPAGWYPMRRDAGPPPPFVDADSFPFLEVAGDGVYEIPVGPVHAGVIEPGHFRFSVVGERILKLKARLWFTHRGVEKLFEGLEATGATYLAERISGDTSAAHALAHSLAVEDALGIALPEPAHRLRALVLELERLYNHAADVGALANDVGFSLANAHAQRIREQLLRINDATTGHRLLRGAISPGVVELRALPDPAQLADLAAELEEVAQLTLANTVIRDRFTGTAALSLEQVRDLGCLGYVARASGLAIDARTDHPTSHLAVSRVLATGGDVLARFTVRRDEFAAGVRLATDLIGTAGDLAFQAEPTGSTSPGEAVRSGVGIAEGWRGTVVHRVEVAPDGRLTRAKVVDPSWFNWPAVPLAMRDTIVPDFPVANKSFNLSYAGNDL